MQHGDNSHAHSIHGSLFPAAGYSGRYFGIGKKEKYNKRNRAKKNTQKSPAEPVTPFPGSQGPAGESEKQSQEYINEIHILSLPRLVSDRGLKQQRQRSLPM